MEIKIPPLNGEMKTIKDKTSMVLIGANGSGKTRMSTWIEYNNAGINIHRISAQKSLNMPRLSRPSEIKQIQETFLYGSNNDDKEWLKQNGKKAYRWGNSPETHLLDDFSTLMTLLVTEEYEKSLEFRKKRKDGNDTFDNTTKLEILKSIWEDVIPNKTLEIEAGKIEVLNKNAKNPSYNGADMSDGERAIFYFIGEVLCVLDDSLIIVDEPENHLHKSILVRLWNAIEAARPDCMFLYITHDLEFAKSRTDSQIIWIKDMPKIGHWEYELISGEGYVIDALSMEIMGNRQNVLLVEGKDSKSLDKKFYERLFPEYNVIAVESCDKVIECTKAYNRLKNLNYVSVKGIIDRDRRSDKEVEELSKDSIYCLGVAEVENLFLLPEIIEIVAEKLYRKGDFECILASTKENVLSFLRREIDNQALLFAKQEINNELNRLINKSCNTIGVYKQQIDSISNLMDVDKIFDKYKREIQSVIDTNDYNKALKIINNKGLIDESKMPSAFGWKRQSYTDYVLRLLSNSKDMVDMLRKYIRIN